MRDESVRNEARDLLRRLAAGDERSIRSVFAAAFRPGGYPSLAGPRLDRGTRELVRLAALLALDAPATSLRWSVELASAAGLDESALVAALVTAAPITGSAQVVASAPSLALALDLDPPLRIGRAEAYTPSSPAA